MTATTVRPVPHSDPATEPYWAAARERRLVMPHCLTCGRYHFYPRSLCPHCASAQLEWAGVPGTGTLYSYTVVNRAPSPAFEALVPYIVAVIELDEGPHLMSNLTECAPERARIGMRVRVDFQALGDGVMLPVFVPLK